MNEAKTPENAEEQIQPSRVIRISLENFNEMKRLKERMRKKQGWKKISHNKFFAEVLKVAELLIDAKEEYAFAGRLYKTSTQAWSESVLHAVETKTKEQAPTVVLLLGPDDSFEVTGERV